MSKTGFSRKSSVYSYVHFDNNGIQKGCSKITSVSGDLFHYDDNNVKIGYSHPAIFGGYVHYDNEGRQTGRSDIAPGGGYFHYDANGNQSGYSVPAPLDGFVHFNIE